MFVVRRLEADRRFAIRAGDSKRTCGTSTLKVLDQIGLARRPHELSHVQAPARVEAVSVSTKRVLDPWAMQSVAFARALPPKEKE